MKLVTIETIPGQEFEALDVVKGTVVYSKNFGRDFMAGMKTLVGGEIVGYTEMLNEARAIATLSLIHISAIPVFLLTSGRRPARQIDSPFAYLFRTTGISPAVIPAPPACRDDRA